MISQDINNNSTNVLSFAVRACTNIPINIQINVSLFSTVCVEQRLSKLSNIPSAPSNTSSSMRVLQAITMRRDAIINFYTGYSTFQLSTQKKNQKSCKNSEWTEIGTFLFQDCNLSGPEVCRTEYIRQTKQKYLIIMF